MGDPRDGSIWALFVDPANEGCGIGRALLALACDTVRVAAMTATCESWPTNYRLTDRPGNRTRRAILFAQISTSDREQTIENDLRFVQ